MQRCEHFSPPFLPLSCAEVAFNADAGKEWCGAATWVGIVVGDTPRLYVTLVNDPDEQQQLCPGNFTVRLPLVDLPDAMKPHYRLGTEVNGREASSSTAAVHIQCRAGTPRLEHDRLLLCGDIAAIQLEDSSTPWLAPLLRATRTAHPHPSQPAVHG